jgi:hypothetical protein
MTVCASTVFRCTVTLQRAKAREGITVGATDPLEGFGATGVRFLPLAAGDRGRLPSKLRSS